VFKSWQIFVFSLVPLALVFTGVIIGSMHGLDSSKETFPAAAAASTSGGGSGGSGGPSSAAPAAPGTLSLTASNLSFDKRSLTALPNTQTKLQFENKDGGVLHNFSIYTNNRATTKIFVGELTTGPSTTTYTFTSPAAGTYFFRCDSHPDQMTGTFNVK
jgi:plastocyanin